jgi:enterochelin esterase family protein
MLTQTTPGVWTHTLTLPRDAYLEYAFWQDGQRFPDPLNPNTVPDGIGHRNSYFYMPQAAPTPLTRRQRGVPQGSLTRLLVEPGLWVAGGRRMVELYQPPASEPCPLLVVLDGQDYRAQGKIVPIVDNLIAQQRIAPLALALVHHGRQARVVEYACSEATLTFLTGHVVPLAQDNLSLIDPQAHPGAYGILGASMGGVMALFAGLRAPDLFGHVFSQSGAFALGGAEPALWDLIRYGPVLPLRIWLDAGRYEGLVEPNRRLRKLLVERDYEVTYREHNGGHNYSSWRDGLWRGLEYLFPAKKEAQS